MKKHFRTVELMKIAVALEARYRRFHASAKLPARLAGRASAPLLVYPHERWVDSTVKLLVVGQETLRWPDLRTAFGEGGIRNFKEFSRAQNGVTPMWELYRQYSLGRQHPKMNSAFWRGFRALDEAVNPIPDSALWTNIFKVNVNGSVIKNCTRAEIAKIHKAQEGLLRHEIDVLKPEVVVFFTGPTYDAAIRSEFGDVDFQPFVKASGRAAPLSSLALVRAPGLPVKTVRSYHPEYLQRSRQWKLISTIARWAKPKAIASLV